MRRGLVRLVAILTATVLVVVLTPTASSAGEGQYIVGSPDKLDLTVCFAFDVGNDFNPNTPWEETLTRSSELLYNATDGQVQLGTISIYKDCSDISDKADIIIQAGTGGANAHPEGLGNDGTRMEVFNDTHSRNEPAARGQFGVVHEIGHYVFGLFDSYLDAAGNTGGMCIDATGTVASIMDGGTTVQPQNQRTEFALSSAPQVCENTQQFARRGMMDWPWIVQYASSEFGATLVEPAAYDTSMPAGHQAVVFNYYSNEVRSVMTIDRSGSMTGDKLTLAKRAAQLFIVLNGSEDRLGVASFADGARTDFDLDLMTLGNKVSAVSAVESISAGGSTNIGGGLQTSLDMILNEGPRVSNEVVVLLSDGQHNVGTDPISVVPALQARGVTVFAIGLGAGADSALLSELANQTGGSFFFASSTFGLLAQFSNIHSQVNRDGIISESTGTISNGESTSLPIEIDTYSEAGGKVSFIVTWNQDNGLTTALRRPDGSSVSSNDPDVELHETGPQSALYRMSTPAAGSWSVDVTSGGATEFTVQAMSDAASGVTVSASSDKGSYASDEPIELRTVVVAPPTGSSGGQPVVGASVTADVIIDGAAVDTIELRDDGLESSGDVEEEDGVYSTRYLPPMGGNVLFDLTIENETGTTWAPGEALISPSPGKPVSPFVRRDAVTVFAQAPTVLPEPCQTLTPTIIGTEGRDKILGTEGDDIIFALGGNDVVRGRGGNDIICGGPGVDTIFGGAGDDEIYGEEDSDRLNGQTGADLLFGAGGNDRIFGGVGGDRLDGGDGRDRLWGQDHDDILLGGDGDDILLGQSGVDLIQGGPGNDQLFGGNQDDGLFGEAGNDALYGERGVDFVSGGDDIDKCIGGVGKDQHDGTCERLRGEG